MLTGRPPLVRRTIDQRSPNANGCVAGPITRTRSTSLRASARVYFVYGSFGALANGRLPRRHPAEPAPASYARIPPERRTTQAPIGDFTAGAQRSTFNIASIISGDAWRSRRELRANSVAHCVGGWSIRAAGIRATPSSSCWSGGSPRQAVRRLLRGLRPVVGISGCSCFSWELVESAADEQHA
jgi:hypothetical protein